MHNYERMKDFHVLRENWLPWVASTKVDRWFSSRTISQHLLFAKADVTDLSDKCYSVKEKTSLAGLNLGSIGDSTVDSRFDVCLQESKCEAASFDAPVKSYMLWGDNIEEYGVAENDVSTLFECNRECVITYKRGARI